MNTLGRSSFIGTLAMVALLGSSSFASAEMKAGSQVYEGLVKHVSTDNIKVWNPKENRALSFAIVPRFGNVFRGDKQVQMADLKAGQYVKVYYDQKLLGVKHADRILIMTSMNQKVKTDKS